MQDAAPYTFAISRMILSTCATAARAHQHCRRRQLSSQKSCRRLTQSVAQPQAAGQGRRAVTVLRQQHALHGLPAIYAGCLAHLRLGRLVVNAELFSPRHPVGVIRRRRSPRQVRPERQPQELLDVVQLHAEERTFSSVISPLETS
jgi:hypothetical protein